MEACAPNTVSAIIVTHNSGTTLVRCLQAILGQREVVEALVIDNASEDASVAEAETVAAADRRVQVFRNARNLGFAAACNQAARHADSAWLLFLNPDCFVGDGALRGIFSLMRERREIGVVGANIVAPDGKPEPAARRNDLTGLRLLGEILRRCGWKAESWAKEKQGEGLSEVDAVSGAFMLVPRATFDAVSGFDPGYRLHAEDIDLCRRIRDINRRVVVAESISVVHVKGVSSRSNPWFVAWHKHKGMTRYLLKFGGGAPRGLALVLGISLVWLHFLLGLPKLVLRPMGVRRRLCKSPSKL